MSDSEAQVGILRELDTAQRINFDLTSSAGEGRGGEDKRTEGGTMDEGQDTGRWCGGLPRKDNATSVAMATAPTDIRASLAGITLSQSHTVTLGA